MALTPQIRAPQAGAIVAVRQSAQEVRTPQGSAQVIYNIPAESIRATYGGSQIVVRQTAVSVKATQATAMLIMRGVIENPKLKAWGFTLDGHDFYVLRLGTNSKTLIFDLSTGQWSWWNSEGSFRWRPNLGFNWYSSGSIPNEYGSNVIVGDDSTGVLWVLDPEQGYDDDFFDPTRKKPFTREATGQIAIRGRTFEPIYSVDLTASLGEPSLQVNSVTLSYSDDSGHTYIEADQPQTSVFGNYTQEIVWRSLGQVQAPGRLFKIKDNGAFARIDSMDINV